MEIQSRDGMVGHGTERGKNGTEKQTKAPEFYRNGDKTKRRQLWSSGRRGGSSCPAESVATQLGDREGSVSWNGEDARNKWSSEQDPAGPTSWDQDVLGSARQLPACTQPVEKALGSPWAEGRAARHHAQNLPWPRWQGLLEKMALRRSCGYFGWHWS